ncbi:cellular tumor antigen p53-like [Pollicipes pollicipes]|uniref:cellular tumor antigen p53-like n=1 Tax=Pollicipes pollicipes TaxID=41117 RepID=UPI0018858016|nr:cellular tumor antigen p53-like [Pollicipes pollicipes]
MSSTDTDTEPLFVPEVFQRIAAENGMVDNSREMADIFEGGWDGPAQSDSPGRLQSGELGVLRQFSDLFDSPPSDQPTPELQTAEGSWPGTATRMLVPAQLSAQQRAGERPRYVLPHPSPPPAPVTSPVQPSGDRFVESAVNNAIPALENWPGQYDFHVTVRTPPPAQHGRQQPYVYDTETNKLYVDMMIAVPFGFSVADGVDTSQLSISALPVYPEMHHVNNPVRRCPTHRQPDDEHNAEAGGHVDHVIRAVHQSATYRETGTTKERRSVVVPYERPQPGTDECRVLYKFCCMNTCVGGINRRRLVALFTLEDRSTGETLGRQTVEVKVCKCPHRDFRTDQMRRRPSKPKPRKRPLESVPPPPRRQCVGQLVVPVDDEAMYEYLVSVRDALRTYRLRVTAPAVAEEPVEELEVTPDVHRRPTLPSIKMEAP